VELRELRRWWLVGALALLGALVGLIVSLASSPSREAEALVLISSPSGTSAVNPFLPNLRELATSGVLAGNVRSTLRLNESVSELSDHLDAEVRPHSQVIAISATDEEAEKARQIAQEAAVVFTQLVQSRFGERSPPLQAALIDSAQLKSLAERHVARNVAVGAVVGLLLGMLGTLLMQGVRVGEDASPRPEGPTRDLRKRESQLEERVTSVAARERELAKRAGELAARRRELEGREKDLAARADRVNATKDELAKAAQAVEAPESREVASDSALDVPLTEPALAAQPAVAPGVGWNINDLEHVVNAQGRTSPGQAEEWRTYLYFLRAHASADGVLPASFHPLISDVFGEIIDPPPSS
jgi:capsular polysaccharide biosynthesis protein